MSAEDVLLLFGDVPVVQQHVTLVAHALGFWLIKADLTFLAGAGLAHFLATAFAEPDFCFDQTFKGAHADEAVFWLGISFVF